MAAITIAFTLYAQDIERFELPAGVQCREAEKVAKAHAVASATLVGLYGH